MRSWILAWSASGALGLAGLAACGGATAPSRSTVDDDGGAGSSGGASSSGSTLQCQAGWAVCEGSCTNLQSDSNHCGTCGNACPSGERCEAAVCVTRPPRDAGAGTPGDSGLPANPGGPAPDGGSPTENLAISTLHYGDADRNNVQSATAWQLYGLNLDGKTTTVQSTNVCTLAPGAAKSVQVDGPGGIDNSFGENILPILETIDATFSQAGNADLLAGDETLILSIPDLGPGMDYNPLPGTVYRASPASGNLQWNGTDLRNYDMGYPPVGFPGGYMSQRVYVAEPPSGMVPFDMHSFGPPMPGALAPLDINYAQLEVSIVPSGLTGFDGTIAGVVGTNAMVGWIQAIAGTISPSLCGGSAFQSIAMQIEQAADIVLDPDGSVSNDAGATCNAISLGMGFDATQVQLGGPVTVPTPTITCP